MSVNYSPLRSNFGFQSSGFEVDSVGNIVTTGDITAEQLYIKGLPLLEDDDSSVSLSVEIQQSSLRTLGELYFLEVSGDVSILDINRDNNVSIVDGLITINSTNNTTPGTINNIEIGNLTPQNANFKTVIIGSVEDPATLTVNGNSSLTGTALINQATITTGTVITLSSTTGNVTTVNSTTGNIATVNSTTINTTDIDVDDVTINNTPVEAYHATRKDYVDTRITALSIALGA